LSVAAPATPPTSLPWPLGIADVVAVGKDIPAVEVIDLAVEIVVDAIGRIIVHPQAGWQSPGASNPPPESTKAIVTLGSPAVASHAAGALIPANAHWAGLFGIIGACGAAGERADIVWFGVLDRSVGFQGRHRRCLTGMVDVHWPAG
jgi:hypothetical protein